MKFYRKGEYSRSVAFYFETCNSRKDLFKRGIDSAG